MRSVVERSDTFQRLPITLRAPAKWKARVSPRMPLAAHLADPTRCHTPKASPDRPTCVVVRRSPTPGGGRCPTPAKAPRPGLRAAGSDRPRRGRRDGVASPWVPRRASGPRWLPLRRTPKIACRRVHRLAPPRRAIRSARWEMAPAAAGRGSPKATSCRAPFGVAARSSRRAVAETASDTARRATRGSALAAPAIAGPGSGSAAPGQ